MKRRIMNKYFVLCGGKWVKCKQARPTPKGWLEYVLSDGTFGLTSPKKWKLA